MDYKFESPKVSKEQKMGFVFLLLFAILTIGLAVLQLRNTIYGPFTIRLSGRDQVLSAESLTSDERLQSIDTDHDGLNDYDELFFYETSPYIPDTDSDGIDDKVEIDADSDPLCPEGESCSEVVGGEGGNPVGFETTMFNSETEEPVLGGQQVEDVAQALTDPVQIRKMLVETGQVTEEQLAGISDEQLLLLVQEAVEDEVAEVKPVEEIQ